MRDGTLRCVIVADGDGIERRWARLSDVWALRDRLSDRVMLPDLAEELGVRYHELYQTCRRLGLELERHRTSRQFEICSEAAQLLRVEHARVRGLHQRSIKLAVVARRLNLAASTVGLMAKRGQLEVDPETDSSGAADLSPERQYSGGLSAPAPLNTTGREMSRSSLLTSFDSPVAAKSSYSTLYAPAS